MGASIESGWDCKFSGAWAIYGWWDASYFWKIIISFFSFLYGSLCPSSLREVLEPENNGLWWGVMVLLLWRDAGFAPWWPLCPWTGAERGNPTWAFWQVSSAFSHLLWLQTNLVLPTGMVSEDHSKKTLSRFLFPDVGTGVSDAPQ